MPSGLVFEPSSYRTPATCPAWTVAVPGDYEAFGEKDGIAAFGEPGFVVLEVKNLELMSHFWSVVAEPFDGVFLVAAFLGAAAFLAAVFFLGGILSSYVSRKYIKGSILIICKKQVLEDTREK